MFGTEESAGFNPVSKTQQNFGFKVDRMIQASISEFVMKPADLFSI